jgi:hypothetical protein
MLKEGKTWRYDAEPRGEPIWMQTVDYRTSSCIVEEVTFEQSCENCPVFSATGPVSSTYASGTAVRGHTRYVWHVDDEFVLKDCYFRKLTSSTGTSVTTDRFTFIRDSQDQVDLILNKTDQTVCENRYFTAVMGQPNIRVDYFLEKLNKREKPNTADRIPKLAQSYVKGSDPGMERELDYLDHLQPHLQWLEDRITEMVNTNAQRLQVENCHLLRSKLRDVLLLSKTSPLLASQVMGYQSCSALEMHGKTGILRQCRQKFANFSAETTACGPQPIFKDGNLSYTIGKDGISLQPFSPCFWTGQFVNFNRTSFEWHANDWIPLHMSILPPNLLPFRLFNYTIDDSREFVTRYQKPEAIAMNLFAELSRLVPKSTIRMEEFQTAYEQIHRKHGEA